MEPDGTELNASVEQGLSHETKADALFNWYRDEKSAFARQVYMSQKNEFSKFFRPYSNWNTSEVLRLEKAFYLAALGKLSKYLGSSNPYELRRELALVILSLKNRAEFASNQSDGYPVLSSFVSFGVGAAAGFSTSLPLKFLLTMVTALFVFLTFYSRIHTRREVATLKQLSNLLEQYKADLTASK